MDVTTIIFVNIMTVFLFVIVHYYVFDNLKIYNILEFILIILIFIFSIIMLTARALKILKRFSNVDWRLIQRIASVCVSILTIFYYLFLGIVTVVILKETKEELE